MCVDLFGGVWTSSCARFALRRVAHDLRLDFPEETIQAVLKGVSFQRNCGAASVGVLQDTLVYQLS